MSFPVYRDLADEVFARFVNSLAGQPFKATALCWRFLIELGVEVSYVPDASP